MDMEDGMIIKNALSALHKANSNLEKTALVSYLAHRDPYIDRLS